MAAFAKVVLWRCGSLDIALLHSDASPRLRLVLTDNGLVVRDEAMPDPDEALRRTATWSNEFLANRSPEEPTRCPVLVVEDDDDLRAMMGEMLTLEGFAPTLAPNGRQALDLLKAGPAPHVILLDLMMPVMDGWTFREHQQRDPALAAIPVIVVTAAHDSLIKNVDATAILRKPLEFDALVSLVRAHC